MNRSLLFFTALLLLFGGASLVWFFGVRGASTVAGSQSEVDPDYQPPAKELTDFQFTDQMAKPFDSKELEGKVWLGSFFFADCPSICVDQNTEIAKVHRRFRDRDVVIVNITVAPDKDPPHKLWDYANRFEAQHASWKFLTGKNIRYVRQVGIDIFGLAAADESHTTEVAIFDRNGKKQGAYDVTKAEEYTRLVNKVEELLEAPAAEPDPVLEAS